MKGRIIHMVLVLLLAQLRGAAQERTHTSVIDTVDMLFKALTINDGLSQGMVNTIMQDDLGFMWFGTKDGLNRYDGYTFTVFRHDPEDSTTIRESTVNKLYQDDHNRMWVGTSAGLDLFDRNTERFIHVPIQHPKGSWGSIVNIVLDFNGDLWVSSTEAMAKLTFERPLEEGRPLPPFTTKWYSSRYATVSRTRDGRLWGCMDSIAYRLTPRHEGNELIDTLDRFGRGDTRHELRTLSVLEDTLRNKIYANYMNGIVELDPVSGKPTYLYVTLDDYPWIQCDDPSIDVHGVLWISTFRGLYRFDPVAQELSLVRASDANIGHMIGTVKRTMIDRNGTMWVGTSGYGLLKYDQRIERFNNWSDASIRALQPGNNGSVIVTRFNNFLNVFDPKTRKYIVEMRSAGELRREYGLFEYSVCDFALQDEQGVYWMSMPNGQLMRYDAARNDERILHSQRSQDQPKDATVFPLLLGRNGTLWYGGEQALWRLDRRTLSMTPFPWPITMVNDPYPFTAALHEGPDGIMWAGTMKGLLRLDPVTGAWKHYQNEANDPRSLAVNIIFSIAPDPQDPINVLWLGMNGGGLNRFDARTGDVTRFTTADGLPNDVVYGVLSDDRGRLWMSTNKGISRFDPRTKSFRNFSAGDGLQSDEFNRHAYCKDENGRLYFGGVSGFNWFDTKELEEDTTPVTVRITGIELMNKPVHFGTEGSPLARPVHLSEGMEIPYSSNMVSFSFASMEYAAPELHQYRYKLEGFDPDWIDAGTDNSAIYTNLDPGTYTFRVRGMNRDGIWDEQGTSFRLTVQPPWYMTWWFYALVVFVLIGGTLYYIRGLRKQREKLEMTVFMRTHELSREKDRADELLKNILPAGIAAELKRMGHAEARHYDQVTVLFSDFRDFTGVSEKLSPSELVDELNVCFNAFDRIMEKHGVEKIKTIGDAYMAAGGVPDPSGGLPASVVRAALEMQGIMAERRLERGSQGKPSFEMRVGIHTGPVVAGIVGRRKFQYDIWGDTVNIASRMESSGEVGEVNISSATYAFVKDEPDLQFRSRGRVQAKGKGEMEMYFVSALASAESTQAGPVVVQHRPETVTTHRQPLGLYRELKDLRVLLAEDNSFNVMVAQDELEFAIPGVKVDVASNGKEALDLAAKNNYDVALMDVQMPEMDGYMATRAIRALPGNKSRLPIVALTANVMQAEVDRCMEAGMNAFVPKPFKREELMKALQEVLTQRSAT